MDYCMQQKTQTETVKRKNTYSNDRISIMYVLKK